ncbi:MAG: hypothetical protein WA208_04495, partial [Thermoanaerobaculia bacterium]
MAETTRKAVVGLTFKADGKPDVDALKNSVADLGDAGAKAAPKISGAFERSETAFDNFERKLNSGRKVTTKDVDLISGAVDALTREVQELESAGGRAPKALEDALKRSQGQLQQANKSLGEYTDGLKDNQANVQAAAGQFPGFGNALEAMGGPVGNATQSLGLWGAALSAGLVIGKQVAGAIGTDFEAFNDAAEGLKKSASSITNALVTDGLVAALDQFAATVKTSGDTIAGGGKALEGYNAIVALGVERADALRFSTQQLADVAGVHRIATEGGAEAMRLFQRVVAEYKDPAQAVEVLNSLRGKFEELATATKAAAERQGDLQKAEDEWLKRSADVIKGLETQRLARQLGLDALDATEKKLREQIAVVQAAQQAERDAAEVHAGTTEKIVEYVGQIERLTGAREVDENQLKLWLDALQKEVDAHRGGLSEEQEKHYDNLIKIGRAYESSDVVARGTMNRLVDEVQRWGANAQATRDAGDAADGAGVKWDKATRTMANTGPAADDAALKVDKASRTVSNAGDTVEKSGVKWDAAARKMTGIGATLKNDEPAVSSYTTLLETLEGKLEGVATKAAEAARQLRDLG